MRKLLVVISALVFFLIDLQVPLGVAGGVPYVLTVFLGLREGNIKKTLLIAGVCTLLVIIAFFLSPASGGAEMWKVYTNRGLAIFAIWTTAILGVYLQSSISNAEGLKEKENTIGLLNSRLTLALEASNVGVWEWDLKSNDLIWDRQMYNLYGIKESDFEGAYPAWEKGLHPDDKERSAGEVQAAAKGEKKFDTEFRVVWPSGEVRAIRALADLIRDEKGEPAKMIGVNWDITESRNHQKQIEKSNRRFELVAQGASVGIWDWMDVEKEEEFWSPRFYRLLGYKPGEIRANLENFTNLLHPEDKDRTFALVEKHFKGEEAFDLEYRLKTKSGEYRWFRGSGQALFDENGKPLRMVGSIMDINKRKTAEVELRRSNVELERFAYVVSHDMQAPIRHVIGYSSLLMSEIQDNQNLTDEEKRKLLKIDESARWMQKMLDALLDYSRVGRAEITFEKVDLNKVFKTSITHLKPEILKKKIDIRCDSLPNVYGSEPLLGQVFQNLIANAIKFSPPEKGVVEISFTEEYARYVFTIKDDGVGFEQKYADRVFEIFRRLHIKEGYSGTGVGLAICKHVIERHGGEIWATSAPGRGAEFSFSIPKNYF